MDVVACAHPARARTTRAGAILRRGQVAVAGAVGIDALAVAVPLAVLDHQMATGVGPRVAEGVVLPVSMVEHCVAVRAGADVVAGVVHVAGVGPFDQSRPCRAGGAEPVGPLSGIALPEAPSTRSK